MKSNQYRAGFVSEEGIYRMWGKYSREEVITSKVLAGLGIVNIGLFKLIDKHI
jgi:preprotein translocase subunit Sss1